mgnify:CR=1 FL=1
MGSEMCIRDRSQIDADTKAQLGEIEKAFTAKRDELVERLVERVAKVEPAAPRNLPKASA